MPSFPTLTAARRLSAAAALLAAGALAAPAAAQVTPGSTSAGSGSSSMDASAGAMTPPAGSLVLREPVAEMFTDAKIAGSASVSNMSEIMPSQLAVRKSGRAEVRQFAQRMVTSHTALERQMQQMLQQKGVTPEHNGYSYQEQQNLGPMLRELNAANGRDFDRLYMSHQVASHMSTLHALDTSLIPYARDPQMKAMLQQVVRPAVAQHYAQALALRDAVAR